MKEVKEVRDDSWLCSSDSKLFSIAAKKSLEQCLEELAIITIGLTGVIGGFIACFVSSLLDGLVVSSGLLVPSIIIWILYRKLNFRVKELTITNHTLIAITFNKQYIVLPLRNIANFSMRKPLLSVDPVLKIVDNSHMQLSLRSSDVPKIFGIISQQLTK